MIRNGPICQDGLFCKVATSAMFSCNLINFMILATFNRVFVLKAANRASLCKIQALSILKMAKTVYEGKIRSIDRYW